MIADRTVEAIVEAYRTMQPRDALLRHGARPRPALQPVRLRRRQQGGGLRRARAPGARPPAAARSPRCSTSRPTRPCSARPTARSPATGSQAANPLLERRFGGEAMTMVGTLGRTQPADRGCAAAPLPAGRTRTRPVHASTPTPSAWSSAPRTPPWPPSRSAATPLVAARSFLVAGPGHQRADPGAGLRRRRPAGARAQPRDHAAVADRQRARHASPAARASATCCCPPVPGEMYPQIPLKVRELVARRAAT